jgi:tryptophan-rich sensory protein
MSHTDQSGESGLADLNARELLALAGFVVAVNLVGASPAAVAGSDTSWIDKPWFFPPDVAFPVVWTLLFTLLGVALFLVWRQGPARREVRLALAAFAVQMALNVAWTPAFFGLRAPGLGLVVILALWVAIVGTILLFDRVDRRAAALLVPYLAWVSFAAVLNAEIWRASG